jgi:anti-sigma28 factor (negative regulator of flagellin synthesis)
MINIQNVSASAYGAQSLQPTIKASGKTDPPPQPPIVNSEKVELSEASITISRLREKIDAIPEIRIKMVEEIKQKIQRNDYPFTTNLYKAIDKMLENNILQVA